MVRLAQMPKQKKKKRTGPPPRVRSEKELRQKKVYAKEARARMTSAQKSHASEAVIITHRANVNKFRILNPITEADVENPKRKAECRADLEKFFREYLPASFPKPFSPGHKKVIAHLQDGINVGGKFLDIVFREFGKTTLGEGAVIYASAYGLRRFIVFVGADHDASEELLDSIRKEWGQNDALSKDFPEIARALEHSEGIPSRLAFQLYRHKDEDGIAFHPTGMQWTGKELVFPWIDGFPSSGVVIASRSIMGRLRGLKRKMADGTQARPDYVLVDDPQDDESASSSMQVEKRIKIITRTIINLSGTKRSIAINIPSTILAKNDVIDQLSNPKLHGTWTAVKIPFVAKWADKPGHELWLGEYQKTLLGFDPTAPGDKERAYQEAKAFYLKNRKAMDAGCSVAWEHAFADHEASAIQHAYNKFIELGPVDFNCEFQGKPPDPIENSGQIELADFSHEGRFNGHERGEVPDRAEHLTAFVDVQIQSLFWIVCGWASDFTGFIVDYGIFPEQGKSYLRAADVEETLERRYPDGGKESRWLRAFGDVTAMLLGRSWKRSNGSEVKIDRLGIDSNDGSAYEVVCDFCRSTTWQNVIPWRSRGVGAADKPFAEYRKNPGDKVGLNWRIPSSHGKKSARVFVADVNFWKSFVKARWQTAVGDPGCLTVFGKQIQEHKLFVEHCLCEYGLQTEGRGRKLEEWRVRNPKNQENHWADGLVACAAFASACGCAVGGMEAKREERKAFSTASADVLAAIGGR